MLIPLSAYCSERANVAEHIEAQYKKAHTGRESTHNVINSCTVKIGELPRLLIIDMTPLLQKATVKSYLLISIQIDSVPSVFLF